MELWQCPSASEKVHSHTLGNFGKLLNNIVMSRHQKQSWRPEHSLCVSGINIFLDGYVPTENLRFRETSLVFKVAETATEEEVKKMCRYQYPDMKKVMGEFSLVITEGEFTDSEIMVMLGENGETREQRWWWMMSYRTSYMVDLLLLAGTGKTTFIRMLAGGLKPDGGGKWCRQALSTRNLSNL